MNPDSFHINFEWNPLLIVPALMIAAGLSYFLYRKDERLSENVRKILFVLRFVTFTILFVLLLNPIIRHFENKVERPSFVFAIDNSESMLNENHDKRNAFLQKLRKLKMELEEKDVDVSIFTEAGNTPIDSIRFDGRQTNLSSLLNGVKKNYENRNLSGVLLVSDGLYNRGSSPLYEQFGMDISTLGLGDTSEIKDISINDIRYNEIAFKDNFFPLRVTIQQSGFDGREIEVQVSNQDKVLKSESVRFPKGSTLQELDFKLEAKSEGQQKYSISVIPVEGEKTVLNNDRDVYIEIIEGKDKILILALNPHPDIKAIKSALGKTRNYEIETVFASENQFPDEEFDLAILHQVPNLQNAGNGFIAKLISNNTPIWYILGPQSDLFTLNRQYKGVRIDNRVRQSDQVTPLVNPAFRKFSIPEDFQEMLAKLPPVDVPFGKYETGEGTETILLQSVGRINTGKPLLAFQQLNDQKYGFMAGDGLWAWRMYEYANTGKFDFSDALITKMVQLLSLKEDKRKFRVRLKDEKALYEGESVVLQTEAYNDIFENIYGNEVRLKLKNENGEVSEYSYINNPSYDFRMNGLLPGVYSFQAFTNLDKQEYTANGQFTIRKLQLEALSSKADFQLLRNLADRNNGKFFDLESISIENLFAKTQPTGIVHSREVNIDIISIFWIFFLCLALISIEWFIRKFAGAY